MMITISVNEFLKVVYKWQQSHEVCPRCGYIFEEEPEFNYFHVDLHESDISGVRLCSSCFMDEDILQFENYDNWAIVTAVRAVCDTDIKIYKEC